MKFQAKYTKRLKLGLAHKSFTVTLGKREVEGKSEEEILKSAKLKAEWQLRNRKTRNRYSDHVYSVERIS